MSQRYRIALCVLVGIAAVTGTARGSGDVEGSRDRPLFTRLPHYYIDDYEEAEFDAYDGFVHNDGAYKTIEGHKYYMDYHDAVVRTLVSSHEVGADRLEPHGVASLAPVATNETEEGRSLNRRLDPMNA